jgi:hypothetical protein
MGVHLVSVFDDGCFDAFQAVWNKHTQPVAQGLVEEK